MKLIRFGKTGNEKRGIKTDDGKRLDCSAFDEDWSETFFGSDGLTRLSTWLSKNQKNCPEVTSEMRLGPPIVRPSKIICVGLNYSLPSMPDSSLIRITCACG